MSESIRIVNESTSYIKIETPEYLGTTSTIVFLSSTTIPGQIVSIADTTGLLSFNKPIVISTGAGIQLEDLSSITLLSQPFSYITLRSITSTLWKPVSVPVFLDPTNTYDVAAATSLTVNVSSIQVASTVSTFQTIVGSLQLPSSFVHNDGVFTSSLYINDRTSYETSISRVPPFNVGGVSYFRSTTTVESSANIQSNLSVGTNLLTTTSLQTQGSVRASTLSLLGVFTQTGGLQGLDSMTVSSNFTTLGSFSAQNYTVQGEIAATFLNSVRIQPQQMNTSNNVRLISTSIFTSPSFLEISEPVRAPSVQVSSVSVISTVSTTNLYLTDFTSETVSLSTILFSSALISNSLGNLATSSIQNVQDFFTPSLDLYGAQASTIEVSSLTVDAQLSTIGPSQATMQFFNGSANYISTLDAKVGPMFPFDTTTLSRFTVENLSVNRINTSNSTVINTSFFSTIPWFTSQFPFPYWRMNDGGVTPIMIGTNAFGTVTFQRSVSNPRFSFAVVAQNLWQWPTYSTLYLQTTLPNFVSTPTSLEKFYRVGIVNDVLFDSPQLYYSPFFYINVAPDNTITEVNAANGLYFSTLNLRYNAGDFFSIYTDGQGFGLGNIYFSLNGISFFSVSWQDMAFWYSYWDINNPTLLPLPRNNYYFIDYGGTDYLPANISYTGIRFGPTSPAFFGSTIPFTYTDKRRISTVSAIDSIVRINTLLYSSSITVASQISSLILSVDTLSTVGNYSSVSISSMILTSTARFSTLASGNCFLSSLTLASAPFAATATPRLAKRIGSEIQYSTIYPYVPYLTGVDLLNKFNGVPNINQGFMPYYFMTGTLSYNDTLEHLEITCGPKYEPCIAKFDAYTNYGVALAWMVERPQSYSNIYLNLDFTRARASGSLSINGATQVVFDSIVNPQISTLTLRNFDLKRYPMYQDQILGYPAGTPWIQLTYTGDGNTTTSKFPMVTMWVSDKPTSEDDNTSFLDVSGLSDMQKGYLSFTSSVNGINIFNPFNDMSVRRLFYSGSLTRTSDPALKEEIEDADLSRCFNALSNVPLCRYKYIDSYLSTFQLDDVYRLGVLATDVESEFPKSVRRKEGTRVVDMEQLKYAHLGTTKYLMEKVEALTEKLSTLKGLYATLPAKS